MMNRRSLLVCGAAAAAISAAPARAASLDPVVARLGQFVEDGDLPFASLRIARHGRVLAEAHVPGVERVGPRSLYRIYSMTKPVVAAATVLLIEDGRLTLDTPVAEHVPELADLQAVAGGLDRLEPARAMTVGHLLTHTCGLGNSWGDGVTAPLYREAGLVAAAWMYDPAIGGLGEFARRLGRIPLEFQPGAGWRYGYGLDIAGLVIERVSGERLSRFMGRRIFEPLGMNATGFFVPEDQAEHLAGLYTGVGAARRRVEDGGERAPLRRPLADGGSGGLVSSLSDYGRFADMLTGGGAVDGVRVMSAESARLLMTPYGPQDAVRPALAQFGLGDGVFAQALGGVTRLNDDVGPGSAGEYGWGGAASTGFWSNPGLGLSVVLMTQLMPSSAVPVRETLRPMIYRALAEG